MNVLILYGTNSGGTRIAAELVRDVRAESGGQVTISHADEASVEEVKQYNLVILGSYS